MVLSPLFLEVKLLLAYAGPIISCQYHEVKNLE
jgi:hypothetical protein